MDFQSMQGSDFLTNFTKCGYIFKPLSFGETHNLLLSCFHCEEIFWQLETFLEHLGHHFSTIAIIDKTVDEELTVPKKEAKNLSSDLLCRQKEDSGNDPLREEYKECGLYSSKTENTNAVPLLDVVGNEITTETNYEANEEYHGRIDLDELTNGQLQVIIKLLRENECFWNAENIYHTSVVYKQESLKEIVNKYASTFKQQKFSVNDMRDIIEELKDIVVNENKQRLDYCGIEPMASYLTEHPIYKDLAFLAPHVGPFRCDKCTKIYMDIYAYKFHASTHEASKAFKCMICHKELAHKKGFMCHLRRHTKECPYKCDLCDKSFPSRKEQQRHVIKHGSKPYVCELCAHTFFTQHQLTNHMKNHSNIRDNVCTQCGKGFTHRGLLRQHLQTHDKTECVCSLCNNVYANPRSLRKHYVRVHEAASQEASASNHSCNICMITFSSLLEAKHHRKEHKQSLSVKRKHVCDICGHDFAYPRNLADHKKIHSNIRDQVCDICGKAFTNINLLNQHTNVHNGRKFECNICGKDYAHYRGLCRHMNKVHQTCVKDVNSFTDKGAAEAVAASADIKTKIS